MYMWPWTTKPALSDNFSKWRFITNHCATAKCAQWCTAHLSAPPSPLPRTRCGHSQQQWCHVWKFIVHLLQLYYWVRLSHLHNWFVSNECSELSLHWCIWRYYWIAYIGYIMCIFDIAFKSDWNPCRNKYLIYERGGKSAAAQIWLLF